MPYQGLVAGTRTATTLLPRLHTSTDFIRCAKEWVTPRMLLLKGTMRQALIDEGLLVERDITPADDSHFRQVSLINAMMPLGRCVCAVGEALKF